jgi:hypothetical protein
LEQARLQRRESEVSTERSLSAARKHASETYELRSDNYRNSLTGTEFQTLYFAAGPWRLASQISLSQF